MDVEYRPENNENVEEDDPSHGLYMQNLKKWKKQFDEISLKKDNEELTGWIIKFIEFVINYTSGIGCRDQILICRNSFALIKGLFDRCFVNDFVKYVTQRIFDIIIEEGKNTWCIKKEILKAFNYCLTNVRKAVRHKSASALSEIYLLKIVDSISSYGDYDLQVVVIETIFRMYGRSTINARLKDLIPESQELSQSFAEIDPERFDEDVRLFLNNLNKISGKIFSIQCDKIKVGDVICIPTGRSTNGIWVDFNTWDSAITWYCNESSFKESVNETEDIWNLITLFISDVKTVSIHSSADKSSLIIHCSLKSSCLSKFEDDQAILDQAKSLSLLFSSSEEADKLINDILPALLGEKLQNPPKALTNIRHKKISRSAKIDYKALNIIKKKKKTHVSTSKMNVSISTSYMDPVKSTTTKSDDTVRFSTSSPSTRAISISSSNTSGFLSDKNGHLETENDEFRNIPKIQILSGRCSASESKVLDTPEEIISHISLLHQNLDEKPKETKPKVSRNKDAIFFSEIYETAQGSPSSSFVSYQTADFDSQKTYVLGTTKNEKNIQRTPELTEDLSTQEPNIFQNSTKVSKAVTYSGDNAELPEKKSRDIKKTTGNGKGNPMVYISSKDIESLGFEEKIILTGDILDQPTEISSESSNTKPLSEEREATSNSSDSRDFDSMEVNIFRGAEVIKINRHSNARIILQENLLSQAAKNLPLEKRNKQKANQQFDSDPSCKESIVPLNEARPHHDVTMDSRSDNTEKSEEISSALVKRNTLMSKQNILITRDENIMLVEENDNDNMGIEDKYKKIVTNENQENYEKVGIDAISDSKQPKTDTKGETGINPIIKETLIQSNGIDMTCDKLTSLVTKDTAKKKNRRGKSKMNISKEIEETEVNYAGKDSEKELIESEQKVEATPSEEIKNKGIPSNEKCMKKNKSFPYALRKRKDTTKNRPNIAKKNFVRKVNYAGEIARQESEKNVVEKEHQITEDNTKKRRGIPKKIDSNPRGRPKKIDSKKQKKTVVNHPKIISEQKFKRTDDEKRRRKDSNNVDEEKPSRKDTTTCSREVDNQVDRLSFEANESKLKAPVVFEDVAVEEGIAKTSAQIGSTKKRKNERKPEDDPLNKAYGDPELEMMPSVKLNAEDRGDYKSVTVEEKHGRKSAEILHQGSEEKSEIIESIPVGPKKCIGTATYTKNYEINKKVNISSLKLDNDTKSEERKEDSQNEPIKSLAEPEVNRIEFAVDYEKRKNEASCDAFETERKILPALMENSVEIDKRGKFSTPSIENGKITNKSVFEEDMTTKTIQNKSKRAHQDEQVIENSRGAAKERDQLKNKLVIKLKETIPIVNISFGNQIETIDPHGGMNNEETEYDIQEDGMSTHLETNVGKDKSTKANAAMEEIQLMPQDDDLDDDNEGDYSGKIQTETDPQLPRDTFDPELAFDILSGRMNKSNDVISSCENSTPMKNIDVSIHTRSSKTMAKDNIESGIAVQTLATIHPEDETRDEQPEQIIKSNVATVTVSPCDVIRTVKGGAEILGKCVESKFSGKSETIVKEHAEDELGKNKSSDLTVDILSHSSVEKPVEIGETDDKLEFKNTNQVKFRTDDDHVTKKSVIMFGGKNMELDIAHVEKSTILNESIGANRTISTTTSARKMRKLYNPDDPTGLENVSLINNGSLQRKEKEEAKADHRSPIFRELFKKPTETININNSLNQSIDNKINLKTASTKIKEKKTKRKLSKDEITYKDTIREQEQLQEIIRKRKTSDINPHANHSKRSQLHSFFLDMVEDFREELGEESLIKKLKKNEEDSRTKKSTPAKKKKDKIIQKKVERKSRSRKSEPVRKSRKLPLPDSSSSSSLSPKPKKYKPVVKKNRKSPTHDSSFSLTMDIEKQQKTEEQNNNNIVSEIDVGIRKSPIVLKDTSDVRRKDTNKVKKINILSDITINNGLLPPKRANIQVQSHLQDVRDHEDVADDKLLPQNLLPLSYVDPKVSKPAPSWESTAVFNGKCIQLKSSDFLGKYLVLFFYPLDFAFVCPTEISAFSHEIDKFKILDTEVLACSVDSHFVHLVWTNTRREDGGLGKINFPLLSDLKHRISKDFGVYLEDLGHTLRGLFIIDAEGFIRHMTLNDLPVGSSVDETIRLVQEFQNADKHGETC